MAQGQQGANLLRSTTASKSHGASKAGCITRPLFRPCRLFVLASLIHGAASPHHNVAECGRVSALGTGSSTVILRMYSIYMLSVVRHGFQLYCYREWLCFMFNRLDGDLSELSHQPIQDHVLLSTYSWAFSVYATNCMYALTSLT